MAPNCDSKQHPRTSRQGIPHRRDDSVYPAVLRQQCDGRPHWRGRRDGALRRAHLFLPSPPPTVFLRAPLRRAVGICLSLFSPNNPPCSGKREQHSNGLGRLRPAAQPALILFECRLRGLHSVTRNCPIRIYEIRLGAKRCGHRSPPSFSRNAGFHGHPLARSTVVPRACDGSRGRDGQEVGAVEPLEPAPRAPSFQWGEHIVQRGAESGAISSLRARPR